MKIFVLISLLCIHAINSQAQHSKIISGDTAFWYGWQYSDDEKLKLPHLIQSADSFHFRFRESGQIVDVWTKDGITYNGLVTNYTNSYEESTEEKPRKPSRIFFNKLNLDTVQIRKVLDLEKIIAPISTDKTIKGWKQGFDGIEYIFETATPSTYCFKTYWTPTAQDSTLMEAKMIQGFVDSLYSSLRLDSKRQAFYNTLKPGAYYYESAGFNIPTRKQAAYYKKVRPYRDYMNSVKDTLNAYLNDTLTKFFDTFRELECHRQYFIKFSTDNKLLAVTTNNKLANKNDREEFEACKKKIIAAFKRIQINFVHSKISYWMEVDFSGGKPRMSNWVGFKTVSQW